jgi:hypothetical protein
MPEATLASNAALSASNVFRIAETSPDREMLACVTIVVGVVRPLGGLVLIRARLCAAAARRRATARRFRAATMLFAAAERRSAAA